jgi:hypothetical protein
MQMVVSEDIGRQILTYNKRYDLVPYYLVPYGHPFSSIVSEHLWSFYNSSIKTLTKAITKIENRINSRTKQLKLSIIIT